MKLVSIESSRIILLSTFRRPSGPVYVPDLAAAIAARYGFVKRPEGQDLLASDALRFHVGKFRDVQIQDFEIYPDGLIVTSTSKTTVLDEFLTDVTVWAKEEWGLAAMEFPNPEKHFESAIVVRFDDDLGKVFRASNIALSVLNNVYSNGGYAPASFHFSGVIADSDSTARLKRRRTFFIDRRVGTSRNEHVFYSEAPLRTDDHLKVLASLG